MAMRFSLHEENNTGKKNKVTKGHINSSLLKNVKVEDR